MEDVSVSKGVFAHAKFKVGQKRKPVQRKNNNDYKSLPWYKAFKENWLAIEKAATEVNTNTFRQILSDLEMFVTKVKEYPPLEDEIQTGILLAGVNLPDHNLLLDNLTEKLQSVTNYIATIWSRDAGTLKNLTEEVVYQIINRRKQKTDKYEQGDDEHNLPVVKKTQCTFCTLNSWHRENNPDSDTPFVIIIPDFESFSPKILHDFILILSSYLKTMKFVLIFGVATTLHIVHRSLSYDATSKLKVQVFRTQEQVQSLVGILDGVLSPEIPFKLTGRAFHLLVNIFLFYDFSVNGYLQSYKICMWRHFYGNKRNHLIICCNPKDVEDRVSSLRPKDLKLIQNEVPSFKKYCKSMNLKIDNNEEIKETLIHLLYEYHRYMNNFVIILKCFYTFTSHLPNNPFGKVFRELYANAVGEVSICTTTKYKEAIKMIEFLSKEELLSDMNSILIILKNNTGSNLEDVIDEITKHFSVIKDASLDSVMSVSNIETGLENCNRYQWREKLKLKSMEHRRSPYKEAQTQFIEYLDKEVFGKYLINPKQVPLNEVFCYDDSRTISPYIKGSMKASIHSGLTNPGFYCGCSGCVKEDNDFSKHPDLSIIFKLHLERRKMINLYDLLQSFLATLNPDERGEADEQQEIDPHLQARFTRAVAELQFLGYIKATRKKTDHVQRLT